MLLQDLLRSSADRRPESVALVDGHRRLRYHEVEAEANRLAHGLLDRGVRRGDRVAIWMPNSADAVIGIFAALKAGATFVVLNPSTRGQALAFILDDCAATALLTTGPGATEVERLRAVLPSLRAVFALGRGSPDSLPGIVDWASESAAFAGEAPCCVTIDQDLACLVYTSGSTGEPKGVACGHNNVVFAVKAILEYLGTNEHDVVIDVLPLSFDYGLYQPLMVFGCGARLVLERSFSYPAAILRRIEEERVTGLPGVPTLFTMLLRMDTSRFDLSSLRYLTNTAAALPPDHIARLRAKFPHARLFSMYGQTECKRTLYLPPEQLEARPGSVGVAIPGTEVWLEDGEGARLGPGQVGELVVRGSHVMRGYWGRPEETALRFRPGPTPGERVLHTGDLFRMDEEGYLTFIARSDDVIKSRGEKVAPKEVETILYALEGVIEAAVVGVPDALLGQSIKAFVVAEPWLTEREIARHCQNHLEDFKIPQRIEICAELPRTSSGKIARKSLA